MGSFRELQKTILNAKQGQGDVAWYERGLIPTANPGIGSPLGSRAAEPRVSACEGGTSRMFPRGADQALCCGLAGSAVICGSAYC